MPHIITLDLATLAIAALFYTWRDVIRVRQRKSALLRPRVALLLWAAAAHQGS